MSFTAKSFKPMPVIVGAPRSGTTLLRLMLDAHSELTIPPETGFLPIGFGRPADLRQTFFQRVTQYPADAPAWDDYGIPAEQFWTELLTIEPFRIGDGLRCFYRLYAAKFGKTRWGDKTPGHVFGMAPIEKRLPEAHFIHLIRDGRDVALSWRPHWFAPSQSLEELVDHWTNWVETGIRAGQSCRRYIEVRYEQLVAEPRAVLNEICRFLDLELEDAMLNSHCQAASRLAEHGPRRTLAGQTVASREQRLLQQAANLSPVSSSRVARWRSEMTIPQQDECWRRAGALLSQLGYSQN